MKASNSGLLTAPMLIGIVVSARANGRFVYLTGRYKPVQIAGLALSVVAFVFLAWGTASGGRHTGHRAGIDRRRPRARHGQSEHDGRRAECGRSRPFGIRHRLLGLFPLARRGDGGAGSGAILSIRLKDMLASARPAAFGRCPSGADRRHRPDPGVAAGGLMRWWSAIYRQALATSFSAGIATTLLALVVAILIPGTAAAGPRRRPARAMTRSFRR